MVGLQVQYTANKMHAYTHTHTHTYTHSLLPLTSVEKDDGPGVDIGGV